MKIPQKEDWGDLTDLDTACAYKKFYNKSNEDMQIEFKRNIHARCYDLYNMPIKVLAYYSYGLKIFIASGNAKDPLDITSAIDCLFGLFSLNSEKHPTKINSIFTDFHHLMQPIADNQSFYLADEDIYGNFNEILDEIRSNLKNCIKYYTSL